MDSSLEIGEEQVGEYARWQLEAARNDPRLSRSEPVLGDDFRHSLEEAQRTRQLGYLGLDELAASYDREKLKVSGSKDDAKLLRRRQAKLQGHWERSAMAKAELENDAPHLNASALVSVLSALDALVEGTPSTLVKIVAGISLDKFMEGMPDEAKAQFSDMPDEMQQGIKKVIEKRFREVHAMSTERMGGSGVERYEALLREVGLGHPEGSSSIPASLDEAMREAHSIRNVLVHRGGRIDERALRTAPSLKLEVGHFIRLGRDEYRRFYAAVYTYGHLVIGRFFGPYAPEINLDDWESNYEVGT